MAQERKDTIPRPEATRRALPEGGVLSLDRGVPFLLVHREPPAREDAGTARLIAGEASFLHARRGEEREVAGLVRDLSETGSTAYGAFALVEIWSAPAESRRFTVHAPAGPAGETVRRLVEALEELRTIAPGTTVALEVDDTRHPPDLPPLLTVEEGWQSEVLVLGLEVPPVYRDAETGRVDVRYLRRFRRALSRALRQALYEFVRVQTTYEVGNPLALGTRTVPDSVWEVDRALCALEHTFDLLLLVTPVNTATAWERFAAADHERNPDFHYRLLPVDPDLLKRRLYAIEMEAVDDPALADLFQDKREELDTQLTMLGERGSARFRYGSQRVYGTVDEGLHRLALDLLARVPQPRGGAAASVDAEAFRAAAERELAHYTARHPGHGREIQLRRDVTGLMVSEGNLLIGEGLRLTPQRVAPLLHHEIGTHVLTYVNGRAQPLEQLSLGLADYDELQEGLAVLSEYLCGGLDPRRMRLLAARVVAARTVEEGADFVETFRLLRHDHGYSAPGAWQISVRVHASGGFTRDFIYLRGLVELLEYLRTGGALEPLYVGKIAQKHIPIVEELGHRGVLRPPPLTPRILDDPAAIGRLEAVRGGLPLSEMTSLENG